MKKVINTMFLLLICTSMMAAMHGYNLNFTFSQHNFCDTIPIEFDNDQIYIPVMMNGEEHLFNLDTGSSQGTVYEGAHIGSWTELGNVVSRDANNRQDTVKVISLPPFKMGNLTVGDYVASVFPRPTVKGKYDVIIGFDLFNKGLCAKIDVEHKIMILTDIRDFFSGEQGFAVKYKLKWFVPYVLISPFIRHVDETLFDLGSRPLYVMNKENFDEHAYKSNNVGSQVEGIAKGNMNIGNLGTEKQDEVAFLHLDRLKWGDFSFNDVHATTTSGSSRIGAQMLKYGSVIIDAFRKQIVFQPYSGADSVEVDNKQFGVAFVPKDGMAAVGLVFQKSEAYINGMRQGDIILKINGQQIFTFNDFVNYPFVKGRRYTFTLHDKKGFDKEVSVER